MRIETIVCEDCEAEFDVAERIGTTSRYVEYCPACSSRDVRIDREDDDEGSA